MAALLNILDQLMPASTIVFVCMYVSTIKTKIL